MQVSNRGRFVLVVLAGVLAIAPPAAQASQKATDGNAVLVAPDGAVDAPDWGTTATSFLTIPAFAFQAIDGTPQSNVGPYNRFSPTGAEIEAPVMLPSGAVVTAIQIQGCDNNATGQLVWIMFRANNNGTFTVLSPLGTTGGAATPGCNTFTQVLTTPAVIDNNNTYYVALAGSTVNSTSYTAMRVLYHLQVSPAPATATFTDVPVGSGQHRFVEALVAAGITGGCGPGLYCPNDPLTRGQMAVFLSVALGLHFAP